jgi:hypothetical protein
MPDAPEAIRTLVERMDARLAAFAPDDARRHFHGIYCRTTRAFGQEIAAGGFLDPAWMERWDLGFAALYLDALDAWDGGGPTPGPWVVAFRAARERPDLPPLRHVLFGMNVHINYDLPQSLIAVISDPEFDDPVLMARRHRDHDHSDRVLLARVTPEDHLIEGRRTLLDRLLTPLNRLATRMILVEARAKVWRNTRALSEARRRSPEELQGRVAELEDLCAARVRDLVEPGQVILKLARKGFGVLLPDART